MCLPQEYIAVCKQVPKATGCTQSILESMCDRSAVARCLALSEALDDHNEQDRQDPHSRGWGRRERKQTHKQGINTIIADWEMRCEINHVTTKTSEINSGVLTVGENVFIWWSGLGVGIFKELGPEG